MAKSPAPKPAKLPRKTVTDATDKHIPFLLRKAEKIEEYLNQR